MPTIFRIKDAERRGRAGYEASYIADIILEQPVSSLGFITVTIPAVTTTEPHYHSSLNEIFIALSPLVVLVDQNEYVLEPDDILVAFPGEKHSFRSIGEGSAKLLAIKVPNIKEDKST